jgi:hypothetical protein
VAVAVGGAGQEGHQQRARQVRAGHHSQVLNNFGHCMYKLVTPRKKVNDYRYSIGIQMPLSMIN